MQHTSHFVLAAWSQAQHLLQRWKEQVRKQQITWSWSLRISSLRFETSYPSYRWSHNGFLQLLYLKWHPKSNKQSDTTWEEAPASCRSRYRTSLEQSSGSVFGWYSSIWLWSCAVVFSICFIFLQSFLWFQAGPRLTSCYNMLQLRSELVWRCLKVISLCHATGGRWCPWLWSQERTARSQRSLDWKSCFVVTKICISCEQWDNLIHQENYLSTFAELLPLTVKYSCHPAPHAVRGALPFHGVCGTRECCPIHTFSQWLVGGQFPLLGSCASNNPFHRGFLGE